MENWITTSKFVDLIPTDNYKRESETKNYTDSEIKNLHVNFRKFFYAENNKYILRITADDYFKLYINGVYVVQGPANSYHMHYNYLEIDISDFLHVGENEIMVCAYYHGMISRSFVSGDLRFGMWAEIFCNDKSVLKTDESWEYCIDKRYENTYSTIGYSTQFTENINTNIKCENWQKALVKNNDDHILIKQLTPPIERYEVFPKTIIKKNDTHYIFDFGKELTGTVKFHNTCKTKNAKLHLMCGEEMENDSVKFNMKCNICYDETWTLSGEDEIIENYDYKGFRYLEVISTTKINPNNFSVMKQHYPIKEVPEYNTGNKLYDEILEICKNAVIISSQENYVDCPTREKGQYLGDILITALAHAYISGDTRLYRKALIDFSDTSFITKSLMAVAPSSQMQEIADYSLLYPLLVYNYYKISKDKDLVKKLVPVIDNMLDYFKKYEKNGILFTVNEKWNLVDWPENLRDNYDFPLTIPIGNGAHCVINEYYYGAMKIANLLRNIIDLPNKYTIEKTKEAIINNFYNPKTQLFVDSINSTHSSLHSNTLALFYGITDNFEKIVELITKKGLCCGVFFSYFVLQSLRKCGKEKEMMNLMLNKSKHSWYNMIKEGATSCFEAWGIEQKWNTSLCHPWASAPIIIYYETKK